MGCLEEDPVCFGFIFFGAIFLLVGGGLCGSGMETQNFQKEVSGIVLLSLAGLLIMFGITYFVVRKVRKQRKGRHREKLKRRSRKKLAQLPLVIPVDKPVPHWVVQSNNCAGGANGGATVNPGLIDDFTDEEDYPMTSNHFRRQYPSNPAWSPSPVTQSTPRSPLMGNSVTNSGPNFNRGASLPPYTLRQAKSSPMMYPSPSATMLHVPRCQEEHRCHGRRNSIPFDLYDSNGHLRQDVACHRAGCADSGEICDRTRYCERGRTGEGGSFFALVSMPNLRDAEHSTACRRHRHQDPRYHEYHHQDHRQPSDCDPYHNWRHQRAYAVSPPVFV